MEGVPLGKRVVAFPGPVNLGALIAEGEVLFIDAGLDDGTARKLWRWAEEQGLRPRGAILTHAHADHFGGAHLWEKRGLPLFASALEGAIMEHPLFEPVFLYGGASPHPALLGKFTLAEPCRIRGKLAPGKVELGPFAVEIVDLPGHAPTQIGVRFDGVLFCADALFPSAILQKHPIPFCYDLDQALSTLSLLEAETVVPGHGPILSGTKLSAEREAFRTRLEEIRELVRSALDSPKTAEEILGCVASALGETLRDLPSFLLARTTIFAALTSLVRAGQAQAFLEKNQLLWRRGDG
jgi:glyoxylase-like metal-dependent hydrolase (beta-lactamase superfamily II)